MRPRVHHAVLSLVFLGQFLMVSKRSAVSDAVQTSSKPHPEEDVGLLVPLGFDITAFTPAAYQRGSLPRPLKMTHLEDGFALRCFQRLS